MGVVTHPYPAWHLTLHQATGILAFSHIGMEQPLDLLAVFNTSTLGGAHFRPNYAK